MLYVQQSLSNGEDILMGARFHWMYTAQAIWWVLLGLAVGIAVGYGGIWWTVTQQVDATYPDLPPELLAQAWTQVVANNGGYLQILWAQPALLRFSILAFFVLGLFFFLHMMIVKATTEIAVTNERLIYKKGLVARHVGELSVDRIEGVSVSQEIWGRLLGYGRVSVRGMGVGEIILPPIEDPISFTKAIQEARALKAKGSGVMLRATEDDF